MSYLASSHRPRPLCFPIYNLKYIYKVCTYISLCQDVRERERTRTAVTRESSLCNLTYATFTMTVLSLWLFIECFVPVDDLWIDSLSTFIMSETCYVCLKAIPKANPRVCCNDCNKFSHPECANLSTEELWRLW